MCSALSLDAYSQKRLYRLGTVVYVSILVLHGTYFRTRVAADVPTVDWYVMARLAMCSIGFILGLRLIPKHVARGFGLKVSLCYILATVLSATISPYRGTVIGYCILLTGAYSLMVGLVYAAEGPMQLKRLEKLWWVTISTLIAKDVATFVLLPGLHVTSESGGNRWGMGVTHANQISMFAGIAFWLSFREQRAKRPAVLWLVRGFLVLVMIQAVSRVSLTAWLLAGLCYSFYGSRNYIKRLVLVPASIALIAFIVLNLSFEAEWSNRFAHYATRGQDKEGLSSFTGRTRIWRHVVRKVPRSPLIGHGYGVSRLTMGPISGWDFRPSHCHNEYLEISFNTGLLGLTSFLGMLAYSSRWLRQQTMLQRAFTRDTALHAACIITMLLFASLFEDRIGSKLSPIQPLFFLYLLALDRTNDFSSRSVQLNSSDEG
ncbi:MAG: O-antigen ligase family protein [Planctomycetota bacterium]|jgi:O-antigen ligase